jgi:hypothetical protein
MAANSPVPIMDDRKTRLSGGGGCGRLSYDALLSDATAPADIRAGAC